MFISRSEYDRGINTFSPEGRLFQVEYSLEAIKLGSTAIGVATSHGVLLGVEKRVTSSLLVSSSIEKIVEIDRHIGCAMSGLQADARSMIEHARVETQNHAFNYNEKLSVESCTQSICDLALRFGEGAQGEESVMSRPFGVALLVAGWDDDQGPQLYHAEPSGREAGMKVGIALKPGTPVEIVQNYIDRADMVLIMTVEPGFGGQKFMDNMMSKVSWLREHYPDLDIEVDGGVGPNTINACAEAGANMIVSGTAVIGASDQAQVIQHMRRVVNDALEK